MKQKDRISNNLIMNSDFQSFLFYGRDLEFLYLKTLEISKEVLCLDSKKSNCNCQSCQTFNIKKNELIKHPDLLGQDFEWSDSSRMGEGVKGIRGIFHQLSLSPLWGKKKVAIIRYADYFNKESANALLKSLEEPTKSSYIILLARDIHNVLPTITSRTFNYEFKCDSSELTEREKKKQAEWVKVIKMPIHRRFNLAQKLAKSGDVIFFLSFLEKHVYEINRQELNKKKALNRSILVDRAEFLKKLGEIRDVISRTNANKRIALECVLMDIEKTGI